MPIPTPVTSRATCAAIVLALLITVLVPLSAIDHAAAQTPIVVPFDTGRLFWEPGDPDPATGTWAALWVLVSCGGADVRVDVPQMSVPINQVVPGPGIYTCTIRAANTYAESATLSFPEFDTGNRPTTPSNLRVTVN